jgi:hypothetical protein
VAATQGYDGKGGGKEEDCELAHRLGQAWHQRIAASSIQEYPIIGMLGHAVLPSGARRRLVDVWLGVHSHPAVHDAQQAPEWTLSSDEDDEDDTGAARGDVTYAMHEPTMETSWRP